jgi:hypothetical protein
MFMPIVDGCSHAEIVERKDLDQVGDHMVIHRRRCKRPFGYAPSKPKPKRRLIEILNHYAKDASAGFDPRGEFPHFRKIMPKALPLGIHYEFLDCGRTIGIELHCERADLADHVFFRGVTTLLTQTDFESAVFDPAWYGGCGRIVIRYSDSVPAHVVANEMHRFINGSLTEVIGRYGERRNSTFVQ